MTRKARVQGRISVDDELLFEQHATAALQKIPAGRWLKIASHIWKRLAAMSPSTQRRFLYAAVSVAAKRGEAFPVELLSIFEKVFEIKPAKTSYALSDQQRAAAAIIGCGGSDRTAATAAGVSHIIVGQWKKERRFLSQVNDERANYLLAFRHREIAANRPFDGDKCPDGTIDLEVIAARAFGN